MDERIEQIEAVQRMQNYIKDHLYETVTLSKLSQVSLYSPWYSYRLFAQYLNTTPADYIRRLRLSKSALKLRDDSVKIADVAFEFGFNSVDGYQRAFFREFHCNPGEYAAHPVPIYLFTPYGISYSTVRKEKNMGQVKNVFIQVVEKPERKVIIKRGGTAADYFTYSEEVGCDVWGLLTSIKGLESEPVCMWLPRGYIKTGTSEYVQGIEVLTCYNGIIPEGFDCITLPAGAYLKFQGEPFAEEDYCQAIEDVWAAMKKYDLSSLGYAPDDSNPRIQLEPIGTRGYIELLPIRKI